MTVVAAAVLLTQLIGTPTATIAGLQSLTPYAIAPLIVLSVAATTRRQNALGFSTALVGLGYLVAVAPAVFPDNGANVADGASEFTAIAANVLYSNPEITAVADELVRIDADIVAMAEVTPEHADEFHRHPLADRYPHRVESVGPLARGLVIWSRFPLESDSATSGTERSLGSIVSTPDGPIRVLLVHPPPPVFDRALWSRELKAITTFVSDSDLPTLVLGDFNATTFHPVFREVLDDADLIDALPAVGQQWVMTWPTDELMPPFVSIDHVLIDHQLGVSDGGAITIPGSDHRAVWATLGIAAPDSG